MRKRLSALPEVAEAFPTCRDGKSPVNQEIVTSCDEPPLDDSANAPVAAVAVHSAHMYNYNKPTPLLHTLHLTADCPS